MENYYKLESKILSNNELNASDKIIYSVIANLSKVKGYCWASNNQIKEITAINEKTIQRSINKLCQLNYINRWKRKNGKIVYRFITTNNEISKRNIRIIVEESQKEDFKEIFSYDWLNDDE